MQTATLALAAGQDLTLTPFGARITGEMTFGQWKSLLAALQAVKHAYHCSLADVLNYGRERFPTEDIAVALEQLEFKLADINKADAIGQLTINFRERSALTAEHYFVLSRYDSTTSKKWAAIAKKEGLTALELQRSIEAGKLLRSSDIQHHSGQGSGINTIQGAVFRIKQWETAVGGRDKILALPPPERRNLLELLRPTLELAAELEQSLPED